MQLSPPSRHSIPLWNTNSNKNILSSIQNVQETWYRGKQTKIKCTMSGQKSGTKIIMCKGKCWRFSGYLYCMVIMNTDTSRLSSNLTLPLCYQHHQLQGTLLLACCLICHYNMPKQAILISAFKNMTQSSAKEW
jgi:hypothetical protein